MLQAVAWLFLAALLPVVPLAWLPAFYITTMPYVGTHILGLSFADLVLVIWFVRLGVTLLNRNGVVPSLHQNRQLVYMVILLMLVWFCIICTGWLVHDSTQWVRAVITTTGAMGTWFMMTVSVRDRDSLERFIRFWVASGFAAAAPVLLQRYGLLDLPGLILWRSDSGTSYLRYFAFFPDPNAAAFFLIPPAVLGLALLLRSDEKLAPRILFGFMGAVISAAIAFTGSRSGLVGLGVGLMGLIICADMRMWTRLSAVILGCILTLITGWTDRILSLARIGALSDVASLSGRVPIYRVVLEVIAQRPFLGVGWGNFRVSPLNTTGFMPHNSLLQLVSEGGLITTAAFLIFASYVLLLALRQRRGPNRRPVTLTIIALGAAAVMAMGVDFFYNKWLWALLGLVSGTALLDSNSTRGVVK